MLTNEERLKRIERLNRLSGVLSGRTAASYRWKKRRARQYLEIEGFDFGGKNHLDDIVILVVMLACETRITQLEQEMEIAALKKENDALRLLHLSRSKGSTPRTLAPGTGQMEMRGLWATDSLPAGTPRPPVTAV